MSSFKFGDIVTLKSGGPAMTVGATKHPVSKDAVPCIWFDTDRHVHTHEFPSAALTVADQSASEHLADSSDPSA